jgi:hypothetical protein
MTAESQYSALAGQFPRLSERFGVDDLTLSWVVPNNRKVFGKRTAEIPMTVVDLSVAGALIVGPTVESVRRGTRVQFVHNGQRGQMEVRHVRPADDVPNLRDGVFYGVVFVEVTEDLETMIFDEAARRRGVNRDELNDLWNSAD